MILYIFSFLELFGFIIYAAPVILGAYSLARYLSKGDWAETITLAFCIAFLEMIAILAILGFSGFLNAPCGFIMNYLAGGVLFYLFQKKGGFKLPSLPSFCLSEKILIMTFIAGIWLCIYAASIHSGTDTYLYHLFYPATWIADGHISRITIMSTTHEYLPIYGELLYAWFMLPFNDAFMAIFLQLISLFAVAGAFLMLGEIFGLKRSSAMIAVNIMFYTSLISMNAVMGYTDTLNGSFMVLGFSLMLLGMVRNDLKISILAGLVLGCSAAIKLVGLMLTPLLVIFFSCILWFVKKEFRKNLVMMNAAALVAACPWYLANWITAGNPFYPVKVSFLGWNIFKKSLVFDHSAPGLGKKTLDLLLADGGFGVNYQTLFFYGLLPFISLLYVLLSKRIKPGRYAVIFLAVVVIGLFLIQVNFYPVMAGARQFIPLVMLSSLLIMPLADCAKETKLPLLPFIVVLLCAGLNFTQWDKAIHTISVLLPLVLVFSFFSNGIFKKILPALFLLTIFLATYFSTMSLAAKRECYYSLLGPSVGKCFDIVWRDYENGRNVVINAVGGWCNYIFMEYMPGNKVCYVPISRIDSTYAHEFNSFREMRADPVSYELWLERLKRSGVDYIFIALAVREDTFFNKKQELAWADSHPERFIKLFDDGSHVMFKVIPWEDGQIRCEKMR